MFCFRHRAFLIFSLVLLGWSAALSQAQQTTPNATTAISEREIFVDVGQAGSKKVRLAIPRFGGKESLAAERTSNAKRLTEILGFTGGFDLVPESAFLGKPDWAAREISYPDWEGSKTEFVVLGKYLENTPSKQVEMRFFDVKRQKILVGKRYVMSSAADTDRVLRRFADLMMEALTGERGIFSSKIAFVGQKDPKSLKQIYIANFDGSEPMMISDGKSVCISPSWSPDGSKLTYTSFRDGKAEIFVYNRLTKKEGRLTRSRGGSSGAAWSPDGKTIAFSQSLNGLTSIFTINSIDGSGKKVLITGSGLEVEAAYSPDGGRMAFTSGRFGNPHIFVRDLNTTKDTRITFAGWYNSSSAWRPDGKKLAFAGYDRQIDRYDLFIVNPDGRQLERLTLDQGDNEKPSWSPDGRFLLFQSNRNLTGKGKVKAYKLWVTNRDGGNQRPLNLPFSDVSLPTWGPRLNELDE